MRQTPSGSGKWMTGRMRAAMCNPPRREVDALMFEREFQLICNCIECGVSSTENIQQKEDKLKCMCVCVCLLYTLPF